MVHGRGRRTNHGTHETTNRLTVLRRRTPIRALREEGIPVYFSTDTGATVYVNTTAGHDAEVEAAIGGLGVDTRSWEVGGPAEVLPEAEALF